MSTRTKVSEDRKVNTIISLLGTFLVIVGLLCATVFWGENIDNLIFGIVVAVVGVASIAIYLPLALGRKK